MKSRWEFVLTTLFLFFCYIYVISSTSVQYDDHNGKFGEILIERIEQDKLIESSKFWIYFIDKGLLSEEDIFLIKENILKNEWHPKTIERRLKMKSTEKLHELVNEEDFPVNEEYINEIKKIEGVEIKTITRWGNSISVLIKNNKKQVKTLEEISKFSFVKKIELVRTFKKKLHGVKFT